MRWETAEHEMKIIIVAIWCISAETFRTKSVPTIFPRAEICFIFRVLRQP